MGVGAALPLVHLGKVGTPVSTVGWAWVWVEQGECSSGLQEE